MRHLLLQCGCHPGYALTMHTPDTLNSKPLLQHGWPGCCRLTQETGLGRLSASADIRISTISITTMAIPLHRAAGMLELGMGPRREAAARMHGR